MIVKIKKLDEKAKIPFKTYESDFCYDLVAVSEEEISPNVWKYGFGFALQIEREQETIVQGRIRTDKNEICYGVISKAELEGIRMNLYMKCLSIIGVIS